MRILDVQRSTVHYSKRRDSSESKGREAQRNNIQAAKLIAEIVKTSLGPRGMDKMLVDSLGDVTITNDGATMLKEIDVQHPAAKMMVEVSKATDNEVGDGTTSAVILAGALLEKAEELISKDVHPTVVVDGYMKALEKAEQVLDKIAEKVDPTSRADLLKVATTSMMTKLVSDDAPFLAGLVVDAVSQVAEKTDDGYKVDIDNVKVEKKAGGSMVDTKLISGSRARQGSRPLGDAEEGRGRQDSAHQLAPRDREDRVQRRDQDQRPRPDAEVPRRGEQHPEGDGREDREVRSQRPRLPEGHRRQSPSTTSRGRASWRSGG